MVGTGFAVDRRDLAGRAVNKEIDLVFPARNHGGVLDPLQVGLDAGVVDGNEPAAVEEAANGVGVAEGTVIIIADFLEGCGIDEAIRERSSAVAAEVFGVPVVVILISVSRPGVGAGARRPQGGAGGEEEGSDDQPEAGEPQAFKGHSKIRFGRAI